MKKICTALLILMAVSFCFGCQLGSRKDEDRSRNEDDEISEIEDEINARFKFEVDHIMDAEVSGYSGHGLISLSVNSNKLAILMIDIEDELYDARVDYNEDRLANLVDSLSFICEENTNLSNGDVLTIQVSYDLRAAENLDIAFLPKEFTYTVSGLIVAEQVDPFENLEVTFSGVAPEGVVNINPNNTSSFVQNYISFSIEGDENNIFSNGDEITILADFNTYYTEDPDAPVILLAFEKSYTISGLDVYPSDLSNLDMTSVMSEMHDSATSYVIQNVYSVTSFNGSYRGRATDILDLSITPHEIVYLQPKINSGEVNNFIVIYKVNYTAHFRYNDPENVTTYIAVEYIGFVTDEAMTEMKYSGNISVSRQSMNLGNPEEYASFYNKVVGIHTEKYIIHTLEIPNELEASTEDEVSVE